MRPSADRRAASRPGPGRTPEPGTPGPRRRSPGPAVHGHMSLRGRRRPAPARRPARSHAAWDALLRAAAGPRRPPRPRGDSTAVATPPPPPPPPPGSRDPAGGGGGGGSATFGEPGSRREGEGAHGDAPCGGTWPRGPRAGPAGSPAVPGHRLPRPPPSWKSTSPGPGFPHPDFHSLPRQSSGGCSRVCLAPAVAGVGLSGKARAAPSGFRNVQT